MKYQVVVKLRGGESLPPSEPMEKDEAEQQIETIRKTHDNSRTNLPWLSAYGKDILAASLTPAQLK